MTYEIEIVEVPPAWIASVRRRAAWAELDRVVPELLGEVRAWLGAAGVDAGGDVVVYHQPAGEGVEVECGVQLAAPVPDAPAPIRCGRAPSGRAARASHRGPLAGRRLVHEALAATCRERGWPAGVVWEVAGEPGEPAQVHVSIEPNSAMIAYWNGPTGDRWAQSVALIERAEAAITGALLERAAPAAGERVLDVGCGCGSTTLALRERVGGGGAVTGIDVSAPMLAVARARPGAAGVRFVEADAAAYPFRPEHDLVCSRFGVMFFADPEPAFANLRRAAAETGRLAFVCWRTVDDNPWVTAPMYAAREYLPAAEPPPPHVPGPFAFVDRDRLHGILERAGWREIAIDRVDHAMDLGDTAEQAAGAALQIGPLARFAAELPDEARGRLRAHLVDALAPFAAPAGVALPASSWLVSARACLIALLLAACGGPQPAPLTSAAGSAAAPGQELGKARVDLRTMDGGVISLIGDREAAMTAANRTMAEHCGEGAYTITQEGEELDDGSGKPEWRVHYQCSSGLGLPP